MQRTPGGFKKSEGYYYPLYFITNNLKPTKVSVNRVKATTKHINEKTADVLNTGRHSLFLKGTEDR